jgi:ribonuclease BN (tRNA processing enzyme)
MRGGTGELRITVLGKSPAWQDAGGACSGYLVEGGGVRVLLDCGPGVFAKLRRVIDYARVDAVVISHLHADHVMDLVPYASGLRYGLHERVAPLLLAPPGAPEALGQLCAGGSMRADHVDGAFALRVYDPAETVRVGGLTLRFQPVPHFIPTNAIEVAEDGMRLTYGADCGPNDALPAFGAGTGLLLIEATLPRPDDGHLTPAQACEHGARARARRLVLTHFSDELQSQWVHDEAARAFGGDVDLAHAGAVYVLD